MNNLKYINKLKISPIEIPEDYLDFDKERKDEFINNIVDTLFFHIDKQLPTGIDRLNFLKDILAGSLMGAVETEHYEVAAIIRDIINKIDE